MKTKTTTQELDEARDLYRNERIPAAALKVMDDATEELSARGVVQGALKPGAVAPDFTLPDAQGNPVRLYDLLTNGLVVLVFYRGGWCPYCNLHLRGFQRLMGGFRTQGAQLVAVSPQLPDNSLDTQSKNNLQFAVLSDVGLHAARSFGIVFKLTPELLELYGSFGHALSDFNGEAGQTELPIPATFVITPDRHVTFAHVDADYTRRAEPLDVLQHIKQLRLAAV